MVLALTAVACGGSPAGPTPPPAPSLACPADIQAPARNGQPPVVTFDTPAAVNGAPPVSVSCAPASGTSFAPGTTRVTCTATDSLARSASCGFSVVVSEVPVLAQVKFVAFGDSVTEGTISHPCPASAALDTPWMKLAVDAPQSYPYKLQGLLAARYLDQTITVLNEGKAGELADGDGEERLPIVLDADKPEVLLLLHGFNDLRAAGAANDFGDQIPRIVGALETMVESARSRNVRVLVATLPAMNAAGCRGAGAPGVPALNDEIRKMAADEGAVLVDLFAGLGGTPDGVIGIDGLHPTEEGYTKMAQVWFEAIQREFERPSPTGSGAPMLLIRRIDAEY